MILFVVIVTCSGTHRSDQDGVSGDAAVTADCIVANMEGTIIVAPLGGGHGKASSARGVDWTGAQCALIGGSRFALESLKTLIALSP